jgi:hypothetical protein
MGQTAFAQDYVGFSADGAEYMVTHLPEVGLYRLNFVYPYSLKV